MLSEELAALKEVNAQIAELQERLWAAEQHGRRYRAQTLMQQLRGAQVHRKQLVDRIMLRVPVKRGSRIAVEADIRIR
jgi:hypothetical protein